MKKGRYFYIFCMVVFLAACGQEKVEPGVPLQDVTTEYETKGVVRAVASLKDGTVFAVTVGLSGYQFDCFDGEGKGIWSCPLEGYGNIDSIITAEDGKTIYFVGQKDSIFMYLFAFHTDTKQVDELCNFGVDIARARKIVLLDDKMYIMGQKKMRTGSFSNNADYDFSLGETLLCCSMEDGEYSDMEFEYPINIAESGKGTLLILAYFPDEGYCFMEYNPKDGSAKQKAKLDHYKFDDFAVCNNGNSLIYDYLGNSRGLVLADFDNLELEVDLYMDSLIAVVSDSKVWYENSRVYLEDSSTQKLVGFPLDDVQKKNRTVRLIATSELSFVAPYGCGYALERQEEDWDKIALKVLAQDQDYDLCMGSSSYARGLAMRDSDVLCPLNDVPGIDEYFDRCFPYVREAATTESGEIWMLPFSANLYTMLVHEERAAQQGLNLHNNMTFAEFVQFVQGLSEKERGMFYMYPKEIGDDVLRKYFGHYTSVQGEKFLEYMEGLRALYQKENLLNPPGDVNQEILLCTIELVGRFPMSLSYMGRNGFSVYSIPKGEDLDKNSVTLYYLAVNKKSKYKEEALCYLADLIAYLMKQDELLIFKDYKTEAGSREEQTHKLFENGEVFFAIDEDVYQKDYVEVLKSEQPLKEYAEEVERRLQLYLKE